MVLRRSGLPGRRGAAGAPLRRGGRHGAPWHSTIRTPCEKSQYLQGFAGSAFGRHQHRACLLGTLLLDKHSKIGVAAQKNQPATDRNELIIKPRRGYRHLASAAEFSDNFKLSKSILSHCKSGVPQRSPEVIKAYRLIEEELSCGITELFLFQIRKAA